MKLAIRRLDSRQVAKHAKFRRKDKLSCKNCLLLFSDLCGLGVFAGDIPSFSSGSAVPKRPPWLYTGQATNSVRHSTSPGGRMIMTRLSLIVFGALWVSLAAAQTKSGDRDWQEVINGAKKEGKVVVAGSPDPVMRNDVIPKFTSRYGITVELIAGRSSQIASRVEIERTAGIYSIDLYLAGQDT